MRTATARTFAALLVTSLLSPVSQLLAQTSPAPGRAELVWVASGNRDNPSPVEGVVWSDFVQAPAGTPWMRLYFRSVSLPKGSYLRMVSLRDGDVMTMRQEHMAQWGFSSAYFNGEAVLVQLVAGPNTTANHVEVDRIVAGDVAPTIGTDSICGSTDDRVPSSDARCGRMDPIGCSAWIIDRPTSGSDRVHLSAGHCFATGQVLEFGVPASGNDCSLAHPPVSKQFAIDSASSQSVDNGVGADYWVFRCFPNPTTGRTTFQEQGAAFALAASLPAVASTLRNTGYGVDGTSSNNAAGANNSCTCATATTGSRNQVQQTHTGLLNAVGTNSIDHGIDTCGGNSGSVIVLESTGQAIAIHTHGGCTTASGSSNSGTAITHPGLQSAITAVAGGIPINHDECVNAIALTTGLNGPFSNATATTSSPAFPCGSSVGKDVWFTYTAPFTAPHTFSTCSAALTFDSVLQVFSGNCAGLTSVGCNDDGPGACALGSSLTVNLTGGQTYRVRVGGYGGASGAFQLRAEPGTGAGTITTLTTACGPMVIALVGEPRIGSVIGVGVAGQGVGLPFIGTGFGPSSPFCGSCTLGHNWASAVFTGSSSLTIPGSPSFIGVEVRFQGAGFLTPGGCASPTVSLSDTKVVTIG